MKRWVLAGALAFAAAGHTLASDLPPPGTPPIPPRAPAAYVPAITPAYNWGGIYFGFNLGYDFGTSNWTDPNNFSGLGSTGDWTADAGIETALTDNITARVEYLYVKLQNGSCTNGGNCGVDASGVPANDTVKFSTSMIRLGLDYKFR